MKGGSQAGLLRQAVKDPPAGTQNRFSSEIGRQVQSRTQAGNFRFGLIPLAGKAGAEQVARDWVVG